MRTKLLRLILVSTLAAAQMAVRPTIVYNNLTGNTNSTGAPGDYPLTTTSTCDTLVAGLRTLTDVINWPGNTFSDLPVDGTAVICANWNPLTEPNYPGFPGNPFPNDGCAAIIGRTANTITITRDKFALTENSTCAVGGKMLDLGDGFGPMSDLDLGWTVLLEYTGADYIVTLPIGFGGHGEYPRITLRGQKGPKGEPVVIRYRYPFPGNPNSNGAINGIDGMDIRDLVIINEAGFQIAFGGSFGTHLFNVVLDGWNALFERNYGPENGFVMYNCEIKNGPSGGFNPGQNEFPEDYLLLSNFVHDNNGDGFSVPYRSGIIGGSSLGRQMMLLYNLFVNNKGFGIRVSPGPPSGFMLASDTVLGGSHVFMHNTIYNSGLPSPSSAQRSGIAVSRVDQGYVIASNLSTDNTNYGIEGVNGNVTIPAYIGPDTLTGMARIVDGNAYFRNFTGPSYLLPLGAHDQTKVDPKYIKPLTPDYNFATGDGLLNLGWPLASLPFGINSSTRTGVEPGASQKVGGKGNYSY